MNIRFVAPFCLLGALACSHNSTETAKDPSYVSPSTEPSMQPASFENTPPSPPPEHANAANSAPLADDAKVGGARSASPSKSTESRKTTAEQQAAEPVQPDVAPDNTKVNRRDSTSTALTPMDQNNNPTDLKITQRIRQAVMGDKSLSFSAKNVKIITQNGKVTLRGPVNSDEERSAIEAAALKVAGTGQVDNQLEVKK